MSLGGCFFVLLLLQCWWLFGDLKDRQDVKEKREVLDVDDDEENGELNKKLNLNFLLNIRELGD